MLFQFLQLVRPQEGRIAVLGRETNKIDATDPKTGKHTYRKDCHYGPAHTIELGPDPVDVPAELAGALQPGRYARFSGISIDGHLRLSSSTPKLPLQVYRQARKAKAKAKDSDSDSDDGEVGQHLMALYGFVLE